MKSVVLASHNLGKVREFQTLLSACDFRVKPQSDFNIPSAEETGLTFVENAIIKARHACALSGLPAIADDSGIEVDALKGAPGIYSARFAGIAASDEANNALLLEKLQDIPAEQRQARYQCVLVFMRHELDPTPIICQGSWEGIITQSPIGDGGFGYDPLFYVPQYQCTSAQLSADIKNQLSHRGIAMSQLLLRLQTLSAI